LNVAGIRCAARNSFDFIAVLELRRERLGRILIWVTLVYWVQGRSAKIALERGESLNAMWFVIAAVCCYLSLSGFIRIRGGPAAGVGRYSRNAFGAHTTTAATLSRRTSGFCLDTILRPLRGRDRL